jgi:hypothetical protein
MPRKTILTEEIQRHMCQAFEIGATDRIACDFAGIGEATYYEWMEKGKAGRKPYAEFAEQVTLSKGRAAMGWLAKIERAANQGDWRAAAWKLERRYPDDFGRTITKHEMDEGVTTGLSGLLAALTKERHGDGTGA